MQEFCGGEIGDLAFIAIKLFTSGNGLHAIFKNKNICHLVRVTNDFAVVASIFAPMEPDLPAGFH